MGKTRTRQMKTTWFPRNHDWELSFYLEAEDELKNSTIIPIVMGDEGLGAPSAFSANPENASYASLAGENCFVDSRIDNIFTELTFSLTKGALETDKIHALKIAFMPIALAFKEPYDIKDEVSTTVIKTVLELQYETTDRQGYPLYIGATGKLTEKYAGSATLHAPSPGLTTTQILESVAFQESIFYDSIAYLKIAEKLKTLVGGLKWVTLTKNRPTATVRIHQRPATKRINPYTFLGCLIHLPIGDSHSQLFASGDTTDISHVLVTSRVRYNEWNQEYDFGRV